MATNTTAGILICGDPALAIADRELNGLVVGLIGKMKDEEAMGAFAEYARWTRERDRKCDQPRRPACPQHAGKREAEAGVAGHGRRQRDDGERQQPAEGFGIDQKRVADPI